MKVAKTKGRLRGKQPKLKPAQEAQLVELWRAGKHTSAELAELFSVARSTVCRAVPAGPAAIVSSAKGTADDARSSTPSWPAGRQQR